MPIQLLGNEKTVYTIVREYLDNNRTFRSEKLVSLIKSRFRLKNININEEGIKNFLNSLVKKKLLVEGSKFTRERVLENEKRRGIYEFVKLNPGKHLKRIIDELGLSFNVVIWHLNILRKFEYINKEFIENRAIFYDSSLDFNEVKIYYFTTKDKSKKVIEYLKINDYGITKTQISNDLKIHLTTLTNLLGALEEYQVIVKENLSGKTLYFLNEDVTEVN